jgi:hypothetical protein
MLTSSIKKTIFFPPGGPRRVFLFASKFPSKAAYKLLAEVLPEKLTQAETISSGAKASQSFVMTDLPTPVSPVNRAF